MSFVYRGGYLNVSSARDIISSGLHKHTAADPRLSQVCIKALNYTQETAWQTNPVTGWMFVKTHRHDTDDLNGILPKEANKQEVPGKLDPEDWADEEKRKAHVAKRKRVHLSNNEIDANRHTMEALFEAFKAVHKQPVMYFPHRSDFRTRFNAIPSYLNPQGSDVAKSLIRFKDGKPFTGEAEKWLAVRIANDMSDCPWTGTKLENLSFDDRVQWVHDNESHILAWGTNPDKDRGWTEADSPFCFLAGCEEWVHMKSSPNALNYLPVQQDGTCNGLQHLSMMGRDLIGAEHTNCRSTAIIVDRKDVYLNTAKTVHAALVRDAQAGDAFAVQWLKKMPKYQDGRKVVKRAVMCTPYGVTDQGIVKFMLSDGHVIGMDNEYGCARYMMGLITDALANSLTVGKRIQLYFAEVAEELAEMGLPLKWLTAAGSVVTQSYRPVESRQVETLCGRASLSFEVDRAGMNVNACRSSAPPNVVHSCDASMMQLAVVKMYEQHGLRHFSNIHDSYGVHACDVPIMRQVLKETAYEMYKDNWLERFHLSVQYLSKVRLKATPPTLGDWNPEEALTAEFMFG